MGAISIVADTSSSYSEETRNIFCQNTSMAVTDILLFNFSVYDYPSGGDGPQSPPLDFVSAIKIAFCFINMTIAILGNMAVIIAVYHNPALRSTINYYLVRENHSHFHHKAILCYIHSLRRVQITPFSSVSVSVSCQLCKDF